MEALVGDAVGKLDRLQPSLDRLGEQVDTLGALVEALRDAIAPLGRLAERLPGRGRA